LDEGLATTTGGLIVVPTPGLMPLDPLPSEALGFEVIGCAFTEPWGDGPTVGRTPPPNANPSPFSGWSFAGSIGASCGPRSGALGLIV
jgi:hypothetical protein